MNAIEVRPLDGTCLNTVLSIWNRALVRDPISESRFVGGVLCDADYRPGADSGFIVAHVDGRPAGFVRAIIRRWPNDRVGTEPDDGWIPVIAVDPDLQKRGTGTMLLNAALDYLRRQGRKRVWVCGNTGSAPGYVFPGVDRDAYPGALRMFLKTGFVVDHEPVAMSRPIIDFDVEGLYAKARGACPRAQVAALTPERVQDFFTFLAEEFPGDWNIAARAKVRSSGLHEVLIAMLDGQVVGYCQWEGEHFGPFGVARAARNQGIGEQLFVQAVKRIREADGRTVWFNWADQDAARFYSRFGLQPTRRFTILRAAIS
jgi:mycothiol synthase